MQSQSVSHCGVVTPDWGLCRRCRRVQSAVAGSRVHQQPASVRPLSQLSAPPGRLCTAVTSAEVACPAGNLRMVMYRQYSSIIVIVPFMY